MNNNFFSMFVPKKNEYFVLLSEMADAIVEVANLNIECITAETHEDIVEYSSKIREQKKIGSVLLGKIVRELHNTFVAPFDREDINNLAIYMKDVIDHISSCAKRFMMYSPKNMPSDSRLLAELVKDAAETIKKAINSLDMLKKNPQNITHLCKKLENIENNSDEIYENFLIKLFKEEKDAIEIIKLKDILYELEHATDSAEHVGKVIGTIVVKYA
ncbi:MAG: DUF47 family protein [Lactobacillaceae bacterium]|jgi:uncharacterized protein Yka (UPF0111/DUF47 family)|nr:DUF47 family protein [Lactobacillaceae bacterium]